MRAFDIVCHFVTQRREKPANNVVSGKSFPVLHFEELLSNSAFGIDEEIPRAGHALELSGPLGIQNLIGPNSFRIRIGEQRKLDLATVGEILQYFLAVIADCRQFDPLLFKSCFCVLQLDQLPFAVGSPVGRAEKQKNGAVWSFQRIQALLLAKLVARRESGRLPPHCESNASERLEGGDVENIALNGATDGDAVAEMTNGLVLWIEDEYLSGSIVVQGARHTLLSALGCLGESFVRAAIAIYDDAGPRSGIGSALLGHGEGRDKKQYHREYQ
jgi:hypothetical protein